MQILQEKGNARNAASAATSAEGMIHAIIRAGGSSVSPAISKQE